MSESSSPKSRVNRAMMTGARGAGGGRLLAEQRESLRSEMHLYAARPSSVGPDVDLRYRIAKALAALGLLKAGLSARKIRDRAAHWRITRTWFEFSIERHPGGLVVHQRWRYEVDDGCLRLVSSRRKPR